MKAILSGAAVVVALAGCVDSSQSFVEKPLLVELAPAPSRAEGDFSVRFDSARIAFGPLYLCAGENAGEACDTARLEWLDSRVVELVGRGAVEVGQLVGLSGEVRSWMADYGVISKLTETRPVELPAARELGASVVLRGVAVRGAHEIPFEARLRVSASSTTGRGRPAVSMPASVSLRLPIEQDASNVRATFPIDRWLDGARSDFFFEEGVCSVDRPVVCADGLELSCDESGALRTTRDCAASGLACVPAVGCAARMDVDETSEFGRALYLAVTGAGRPSLSLVPSE